MNQASLKELNQLPQDHAESAEVHAQLTQCARKITRTNKPYLDITLSDGECSLNFKVWEDKPWFATLVEIGEKAFLSLKGYWMKGNYGFEVNELVVRRLDEGEKGVLLAGTVELKEKQSSCFNEILHFVESIGDPRLKGLCGLFIQKYGDRMKRTAAARAYHHARRGGLVEHIAGMMRCTSGVSTAYPELNRDLMLAGCLFHDSGKLWENCYPESDFTMPYSEAGELLGHIPLGIELVNGLWKELMASPKAGDWMILVPASNEVRMHLLHLIASHHGELAFGSPVPPKTPEAMVLHYVDNMDAKIEMFHAAYDTSELIGQNVFQKRMPLPGNEVKPLAAVPSQNPPRRESADSTREEDDSGKESLL